TLTNSGTAPLTIRGARLTGANAADFAASTDLSGVTLAPGESRTISLRFTPAAAASCSAILSLATNASAMPVKLSLAGTGIAPDLSLAPASLDFGPLPLGMTADPLTLVLRNRGNAP